MHRKEIVEDYYYMSQLKAIEVRCSENLSSK
jgi:hypothetical protein